MPPAPPILVFPFYHFWFPLPVTFFPRFCLIFRLELTFQSFRGQIFSPFSYKNEPISSTFVVPLSCHSVQELLFIPGSSNVTPPVPSQTLHRTQPFSLTFFRIKVPPPFSLCYLPHFSLFTDNFSSLRSTALRFFYTVSLTLASPFMVNVPFEFSKICSDGRFLACSSLLHSFSHFDSR